MDTQFVNEYDSEILAIFLEEVEGYLPELDSQLAHLSSKPKDKDALEVAHRLAHTIKGTAASLGFDEVSKHGLLLEQALTPVVEKKAVFTPQLAVACQAHVTDLKKLLTALHTHTIPDPVAAPITQPAFSVPTEPAPAVPALQTDLEPAFSMDFMAEQSAEKVSEIGEATQGAKNSSAWLDEAAELFGFDDLQPLDFIQKLEERQQKDLAKAAETASFELPDWLSEIQPAPADLNVEFRGLSPRFDTPFLATAGVPEPTLNNSAELELPSLDDLVDFEQLLATPAEAAFPEILLPPEPLDISAPAAIDDALERPDFNFSFADAAVAQLSEPDVSNENFAPNHLELADLPDFADLTAEEAALLADGDFDFASLADESADDDDGFGFDAAPFWLAEGQADINHLAELVNSATQPQLAEIREIAATLRKGAEVMQLPTIASQLRVLEEQAAGHATQTKLIEAYQALLPLLAPYQEAANAILNPPAVEQPTVTPTMADFAQPAPTGQLSNKASAVEKEFAAHSPQYAQEALTSDTSPHTGTFGYSQPPIGVEMDKELAEVFATEAAEHIQNLDSRLAALERDPQNRELIREIRRTAHTLKGSAAMVGFAVISHIGHLMEDLLDRLFDGSLEINSSMVELLFATLNAIEKIVRDLAAGQPEDPALLENLRPRYEAVLEGEAQEAAESGGAFIFERNSFQQLKQVEAVSESQLNFEPDNLAATAGLDMELAVRVPISRLDGMMNQIGELVINRTVLEQRNQVYNRAVEEMALSVRRLQRISRELETRYEVELLRSSSIGVGVPVGIGIGIGNGSGGYGERASLSRFEPEFDTLEMDRYTEFHTLSREMTETVSDLAALQRELDTLRDDLDNVSVQQSRLTDDLQDRLVKIRLVPLANLTPRLYRTVRTIAASQDKQVEFVVSGDTTEVDKTIFEEIGDPLLHLIRNAVDHGIEAPEQRLAVGKQAVATIGFAARSEGSEVVIEVSDDGQGIELEALKQVGIERGFLNPEAHPTDEEIYNLMFLPGFSTSETISEISGRGVGLDVVRANIARLKGTIEIASVPGRGTTFSIRLPNTLAITRALLVKAAGYAYAIPLNVIEETTRLEQNSVVRSQSNNGRGSYYRYNGKVLPLYNLSDLLHLPVHARREPDYQLEEEKSGKVKRELPLLIINGPQPYALLVDTLEGQQEVVVKGLGNHLKGIRGVMGATILGSGQVILILNVYELLDRSSLRQLSGYVPGSVRTSNQLLNLEAGRVLSEAEIRERELADLRSRDTMLLSSSVTAKPRRATVIQVVDDSLSIRKVLTNALEKSGFRVRTSKDGQEALEAIQQNAPDLVIMDIEMPRMDGYQLTSILKSDSVLQTIPIVMLTSRAGLKHRQKAQEVGADGFLVKPYQEEELLGIISTLLVRS